MNTRQTIFLYVLGIAAALLAALLLLQMRRAGTTTLAGGGPGTLAHRLTEVQATIAALPDPVALAGRLRRETVEVDASYPLAVAVVPEAVDAAGIETALAGLAKASGVEVQRVTPGVPEAAGGGLEALPMTLRLRGKYDSVAGFVAAIEGLDHPSNAAPRHIAVEGFATTAEPAAATPEWTLSLRTYAFSGGDVPALDGLTDETLAALASAGRFIDKPGGLDIMAFPAGAVMARAERQPAPAGEKTAAATDAAPAANVASTASASTATSAPESSPAPALAKAVPPNHAPQPAAAGGQRAEAAPEPASAGDRDAAVPHGDTAALDVTVEGISWDPAAPRAVVNGRIVAIGDAVDGFPGARVAAIGKSAVTFEYRGNRHTVGVKMFARQ